MSATTEFNALNGKEVSRVYLTGLIGRARKEKNTEVVSRLSGILKNNPGIDRFVIKITNQIKENPTANKKTSSTTVKRKPESLKQRYPLSIVKKDFPMNATGKIRRDYLNGGKKITIIGHGYDPFVRVEEYPFHIKIKMLNGETEWVKP
ncbi:MAG: hypothetical protein E2604_15775, partial [Flavobacterium sp.]|nr:hypothetical protein [Flavobacterium sp.]